MLSHQQLLDSQILRGVARVLELSAVATTTAFTFLHRVQLSEYRCDHSNQELVCACIYLAAKVEEAHVSTNQLINSARVLADPTQRHLLQTLAPLQLPTSQAQQQHDAGTGSQQTAAAAGQQAADAENALHKQGQQQPGPPQQQQQQQQQQLPPSTAVVVGDEYYAHKEQLFMAEQAVLRIMRFELGVDQPHKYLFNFCKLLDVQQQLAAAAVSVLNDAIAYTALVCQHSAAVVAAAALQYVLQHRESLQGLDLGEQADGRDGSASGRDRRDDRHEQHSGSGSRRSYSEHDSRRGSRGYNHSEPPGSSSSAVQHVVMGGEWVSLVGLVDSDVAAALQDIEVVFERCNMRH